MTPRVTGGGDSLARSDSGSVTLDGQTHLVQLARVDERPPIAELPTLDTLAGALDVLATTTSPVPSREGVAYLELVRDQPLLHDLCQIQDLAMVPDGQSRSSQAQELDLLPLEEVKELPYVGLLGTVELTNLDTVDSVNDMATYNMATLQDAGAMHDASGMFGTGESPELVVSPEQLVPPARASVAPARLAAFAQAAHTLEDLTRPADASPTGVTAVAQESGIIRTCEPAFPPANGSRQVPQSLYDDMSAMAAMRPRSWEPSGGAAPSSAPHWLQRIQQPILRFSTQQSLTLFDAVMQALAFSPEIEVVRAELGIREQEIERQQGAFNWNQFVESNWDELNQPVASALDGVSRRLEQHTLQTRAGLRKLNAVGGQIQASQDLGFRDSNSSFFIPNNQALSSFALEYRQPLMRGAGRFVNSGLIQIASTDAKIGYEQMVQTIQRQLSDVAAAYWQLVRLRGAYVIQYQNNERIARIAEILGNRQNVDIGPVQLARIQAAVTSSRNDLLQSEYAVVRAQDQFLRLVYGAGFIQTADVEILPDCEFAGEAPSLDQDYQVQLALRNRPEVLQAIQGIRRASVQNGIAKNQLLPLLGLTLSLSNRGTVGDRQLGVAFADQWQLGDPTYGVGLAYEFPLRNQAARANLQQSRLRLVQIQKQFEQTVADVVVDMRNALREVELSDQRRHLAEETMRLTQQELRAQEQRLQLLLDAEQMGILYLENLLQTQIRTASSQQEYLDATVGFLNAHFQLQRTNGTLLRVETPPRL